jgi:hypothetical protein
MFKRVSIVAALGLCVAGSTASAAPQCIPTPGFVPGQIQPPPNVALFDDTHDVAWTGSRRQSFGDGTASSVAEETAFRTLTATEGTQKYLYVGWLVNVDLGQTTFANQTDGVSLGFAYDNSGGGIIVNLLLPPGGAVTPSTAQQPQVLYYTGSGSLWTAYTASTPTWLSDSYFSIKQITSSTSKAWFVQMRIPLNGVSAVPSYATQAPNGIPYNNADGSFYLFHRSTLHLPDNSVTYNVAPDNFLGSSPQGTVFQLQHYPRPTNWVQYGIVQGPTCAPGFSLNSLNIGVLNSSPNDPLSAMHMFSNNTFVVYPHNDDTANALSGHMTARWKIADWGSQYNDASWTVIGESSLQNVAAQANNPIQTPPIDASFGTIEFNWNPAIGPNPVGFDICAYQSAHYPLTTAGYNALPASDPNPLVETQATVQADSRFLTCGLLDDVSRPWSKPGHQCMQVEIRSTDSVNITTTSVARNMDFIKNSHFEREATIDLAGLKGLDGTSTTDVYLYVAKVNMPEVATQPAPKPPAPLPNPPALCDGQLCCEGDNCCVGEDCGVIKVRDGGNAAKIAAAATTPVPNPQPSYSVHVLSFTGEYYVNAKGKKFKILRRHSGFGYYPVHLDAPLFGWRDTLKGAKSIAPNFYRLAIKNGGKSKIMCTIDALESCDSK